MPTPRSVTGGRCAPVPPDAQPQPVAFGQRRATRRRCRGSQGAAGQAALAVPAAGAPPHDPAWCAARLRITCCGTQTWKTTGVCQHSLAGTQSGQLCARSARNGQRTHAVPAVRAMPAGTGVYRHRADEGGAVRRPGRLPVHRGRGKNRRGCDPTAELGCAGLFQGWNGSARSRRSRRVSRAAAFGLHAASCEG